MRARTTEDGDEAEDEAVRSQEKVLRQDDSWTSESRKRQRDTQREETEVPASSI